MQGIINFKQLLKNYDEIEQTIKGTSVRDSRILPISAIRRLNIDYVLEAICNLPSPVKQPQGPVKMIVIRSLDINMPGAKPEDIKGGVIQGIIMEGNLSVGDEVEIRPGILRFKDGEKNWFPIISRIVFLSLEQNNLLFAIPGGLINIGLLIDPSLTRRDNLAGSRLGLPKQLPPVFTELEIKYYLLTKVKIDGFTQQEGWKKIPNIRQNEILKFYIGSTITLGKVLSITNVLRIELRLPVCTDFQEKVAFSRRQGLRFRLIGWGYITNGSQLKL